MLAEITVNGDTARVGDEVIIRLHTGLDRRTFGSGWRVGTIRAIATDILADEPIVELERGVPVYAAHIKHLTVLDSGRG